MFAGLPIMQDEGRPNMQAQPWQACATEAGNYNSIFSWSGKTLEDLSNDAGSGSLTPDHPRLFAWNLKTAVDKGGSITKTHSRGSNGLTDGAATPVWTGRVNGNMSPYETTYLHHALGQVEKETNQRLGLSGQLAESFRCEPPNVPPPPEPFLGTEDFVMRRRHSSNTTSASAEASEGPLMSRTGSMHSESVISVGTVGHPQCCAEPCRYNKRKSGCREGLRCPNCHKCIWRRGFEKTPPSQSPSLTLAAAPEGAGSSHLDLPLDQPAYVRHAGLEMASAKGANLAENNMNLSDFVMSEGSVGHPTNCAAPCKYNGKNKGCKDGSDCTRCHLCHWQRCKGSRCGSGLTSGWFA